MIFATVGTQLPFDRLLTSLDDWASSNPKTKVIAQTGQTAARFSALEATPFIANQQFQTLFERAKLIVAHAGMGTIINAAELGKQIIIVPRLSGLQEHRNDHQIATAAKMERLDNVRVVHDIDRLGYMIDRALDVADSSTSAVSNVASSQLIKAVRNFIDGASVNSTGIASEKVMLPRVSA